MKVPVVASAVGGLAELIEHEQTGVLVDNLTGDSIAEAVSTLAKDELLQQRVTTNAEILSRKFDGKEQLELIEQIYQTLCSQQAQNGR